MTNRLHKPILVTSLMSGLLLGCPGDGSDTSNIAAGGAQALGASGAVARAIAAAKTMEQLRPPPPLKTLCSLEFGVTSFEAAKEIFGPPADESMDKSKAGLSYRYEGSVTLVLTFDWHNGKAGAGCIFTGIGCDDGKVLLKGYLLSEASLTGLPYPECWPHEEP
jgi:hypothetical protein